MASEDTPGVLLGDVLQAPVPRHGQDTEDMGRGTLRGVGDRKNRPQEKDPGERQRRGAYNTRPETGGHQRRSKYVGTSLHPLPPSI